MRDGCCTEERQCDGSCEMAAMVPAVVCSMYFGLKA